MIQSLLSYLAHLHGLLNRFDRQVIDQFQQGNQELLDRVHPTRQLRALIFDVDSTHSDTYGNQDNASYNAHYRTTGFHSLVAFDGVTGDFLNAQLRTGTAYTSNGVVEFMRPLIKHYNEVFLEESYLVRGDSGFVVPGLYELCEKEAIYYTIRLKSNAKLKALAEEYHPAHEIQDVSVTESYVEESIYQATSWSKARRIVIQLSRPDGELSFSHAFLRRVSVKHLVHMPLYIRINSEARWKTSSKKRKMDLDSTR